MYITDPNLDYTTEPGPEIDLDDFPEFVRYVVYLRVVINGTCFIVMSITLAYLIVKVAQTVEVQLLLETEVRFRLCIINVGLLN